MKFLKLYEQHTSTPYKWKSIRKVGEKLYVNLYSLMEEFYNSIKDNTDRYIVQNKENEYIQFVSNLLEGNVITFKSNDSFDTFNDKITDICKSVQYFSGPFMQNDNNVYEFSIDSIGVFLEYDDYDYIVSYDDDDVIVHIDIDPDIYRNSKKYNV